ncbi:helix-turn-helix domain-containing protein [Halegenticoccus soli]|uniref:helix-turn-helix domain-containing protein n=1 Tax=Halegenticoccus soli TaxID=1985678 RepID=UPI000C6D6CE3|nr:helix-turn-helix domain-containing protein [Halegenticoccus soli]
MSVIAEFTVPAEEFALGRALKRDSKMEIEFERTVPSRTDRLPFFFVWDCSDYEAFEREARKEPEIEELALVERFDAGALYRVKWTEHVDEFIQAIMQADATIVEAVGNDETWSFELRFPDSENVSRFQSELREYEMGVRVNRIATELDAKSAESYGLTDPQREALLAAFRRGYFSEPRAVSLSDLAAELGISSAAATGRMRRAVRTLIANTLLRDDDA